MGDEYLIQVMDGYTNCLRETNKWLKEQSQTVLKHEQLGKILTLPKIDLEPYDGDPIKYKNSVQYLTDQLILLFAMMMINLCICLDVHVVQLKMPLICVP